MSQPMTQKELYQSYLEFVENDLKKERNRLNRRMFSVFFWCLILPAFLSASIPFLIKVGVLPLFLRNKLDGLMLLFPVIYSLYVLGNEVIPHFPEVFRRGILIKPLARASKDGLWREEVSLAMEQSLSASEEDWRWIIKSFKMDLHDLEYRNRYLTALAGAVFFLLMQGIDTLMDLDTPAAQIANQATSNGLSDGSNFTQFVGLFLFLGLLYLSGGQTYHTLIRYLNCAELILHRKMK